MKDSGAGTNLKVGEGAPVRRKAPEKVVVVPSTFLALQVVSRLVSAFVVV